MMSYQYHVVEFLEFPHPGIDKYVCIPTPWIKWYEKQGTRVAVAYPNGDLPHTKQLIRNHQSNTDCWKIYVAFLKYSTDYYNDAVNYIQIQCYSILPKLLLFASTHRSPIAVASQQIPQPSDKLLLVIESLDNIDYRVKNTACKRSASGNIDMENLVKRFREEETVPSVADAKRSNITTLYENGAEFPMDDDFINEYLIIKRPMKNTHDKKLKKKYKV